MCSVIEIKNSSEYYIRYRGPDSMESSEEGEKMAEKGSASNSDSKVDSGNEESSNGQAVSGEKTAEKKETGDGDPDPGGGDDDEDLKRAGEAEEATSDKGSSLEEDTSSSANKDKESRIWPIVPVTVNSHIPAFPRPPFETPSSSRGSPAKSTSSDNDRVEASTQCEGDAAVGITARQEQARQTRSPSTDSSPGMAPEERKERLKKEAEDLSKMRIQADNAPSPTKSESPSNETTKCEEDEAKKLPPKSPPDSAKGAKTAAEKEARAAAGKKKVVKGDDEKLKRKNSKKEQDREEKLRRKNSKKEAKEEERARRKEEKLKRKDSKKDSTSRGASEERESSGINLKKKFRLVSRKDSKKKEKERREEEANEGDHEGDAGAAVNKATNAAASKSPSEAATAAGVIVAPGGKIYKIESNGRKGVMR